MKDDNKLLWIVLALAALAALWWFGCFKALIDTFSQVKSNITYP
jgi:hypothetical protein